MDSEESARARSAAVDLGAPADGLWRDYLALHDEQRRAEALEVLARFVAAAEAAPAISRRRFVERLAVAWLDPESTEPPQYPAALRFPLLQRVVIPQLKRGYLDGDADCTRWLAQATRGAPPSLTAGLPSPIDLLREAHERDPQNAITAPALLLGLIRGLEYVVHEVPCGLLDTPAETLRDIDDASALARALGQTDEVDRRLAHWRQLARSYADYLANRPRWDTWADHLAEHRIPATPEPPT